MKDQREKRNRKTKTRETRMSSITKTSVSCERRRCMERLNISVWPSSSSSTLISITIPLLIWYEWKMIMKGTRETRDLSRLPLQDERLSWLSCKRRLSWLSCNGHLTQWSFVLVLPELVYLVSGPFLRLSVNCNWYSHQSLLARRKIIIWETACFLHQIDITTELEDEHQEINIISLEWNAFFSWDNYWDNR